MHQIRRNTRANVMALGNISAGSFINEDKWQLTHYNILRFLGFLRIHQSHLRLNRRQISFFRV